MSGTSNNTPTSGATGKTDFTGIVNALQMLAQAIGQNGKALDAIKAALPGSLPAPSPGNALDMVRINAGGTAYEVRTPVQVASDIGVPQPATALPLVDGTAAVGTSLLYAREDHVHPLPTPTGWQTIASYTPSAVASQAIPLTSGFRRYRLTFQDVTVSVAAYLGLQVSINGGTSYITTASYNNVEIYNPAAGSGSASYFVQAASLPQLTNTMFPPPSVSADGVFEIAPGSASITSMITGKSSFSTSSTWTTGQFAIMVNAGAAVNAIKLASSAGTFSGTIILEGLV